MLLVIHFLYPEFLYGLFALSIPIILHFFSFKKYKKIYFSNFNFLASLQQQKKNSSRLKNLLLLLLRLTVLAAIVIAFANPYSATRTVSAGNNGEKPQVVIYLDNSFSMSNTGSKGILLEEAKKQIFDILNTYPPGISFTLLTNDPLQSVNKTKEEIQTVTGIVKTTSRNKKLSDLFKEAGEISAGKRTTFFLLSDFQTRNCDFQSISPDSLIEPVFLLLEPENRNNLYIKEVSFDQAFHKKNQNDKISIHLVNSSPKDFNNVPVSLTINDKKKSISKVNLPAGSERSVEISYLNTENGFYKGCVEITDFPLIFDNTFYFSYKIDDKINVLCIEQDKHCPYFGKLFSDTSSYSISYVNINQTANIDFQKYNLIILDRLSTTWTGLESALENYVIAGGNLLFLPGTEISANTLNQLLQKIHAPQFGKADSNTVITHLESEAFLFKDAFEKQDKNTTLPSVNLFYPLQITANSEKLLTDKKGNTLFSAYTYGSGNIYTSAFSFEPENSDLVFHPLFVPLLVNMAYNINSNLKNSWTIHSDERIVINGKNLPDNTPLKITGQHSQLEFIPEIRKDISGNLILQNTENLENAGLYEVIAGNRIIDVLACNFDRTESQLHFCNLQELQKQFPKARVENIKTTQFDRNSEIVKEIVSEDNNKYLTRWFLLLAVIALLAEQWIWRRKLQ